MASSSRSLLSPSQPKVKYIPASEKIIANLMAALMELKSKNSEKDIVIAGLVDEKEKIRVVNSYMAMSIDHPLDTPVTNLILHACQEGYDNKLFIVTTCKPTSFECEAIKIMRINQIAYLNPPDSFTLLTPKKRELKEGNVKIDPSILDNKFINNICHAIEPQLNQSKKGRLRTQDSFLWCDELKPATYSSDLQDELYLGLLYSSLFILLDGVGRPADHTGRLPVAALLLNSDNRPIAFSLNVGIADNSIAHAETGMLLRYFNMTKATKLPPGSKLYTTLESCEMCRAGICLTKEEKSKFKEVHGKIDPSVTCPSYDSYELPGSDKYPQFSRNLVASVFLESLKVIDFKNDDKKFLEFCKANFLALQFFLKDDRLTPVYPALLYNIRTLWDQLLHMRAQPWVGNPLLYDEMPCPDSPHWVIVTEKPDFDNLFKDYYGENISIFRTKHNEIYSKGLLKIDGSFSIGKAIVVKDSKDLFFKDNIITSDEPITLRISKETQRNRGVVMGFSLEDKKKRIGDYVPSEADNNLKKRLFKRTIALLKQISPIENKYSFFSTTQAEMRVREVVIRKKRDRSRRHGGAFGYRHK